MHCIQQRIKHTILGRFYSCHRAVASVEFALVLPVLMLLVMGAMEIGFVFMASSVLQSATLTATRTGKPSVSNGQEVIQQEVVRLAGGMIDGNRLQVTIENSGAAQALAPGQLVVFVARYQWPIFTPLIANFFPNPYIITVRVPTVFEPS